MVASPSQPAVLPESERTRCPQDVNELLVTIVICIDIPLLTLNSGDLLVCHLPAAPMPYWSDKISAEADE